MNPHLPPLDTEPLVYFLFHDTVFVGLMASVFLLLGLAFGWACWGRFKGKCRRLSEEGEALRNEIADLKRKVAELSLTPSRTPAQTALPALVNNPAPEAVHAVPSLTPEPSRAQRDKPAQEIPAMPEITAPFLVTDPQPTSPFPAAPPLRAKQSLAQPPRAMLPAAHGLAAPPARAFSPSARKPEPSAIEPFSFLIEEPVAEREPADSEA